MKKDSNKKKDKNDYVVLGGVGAAIALLLAFGKKGGAAPLTTTTYVNNITSTGTSPVRFPIMLGAKGQEVKNIQNALIKLGGQPANLVKSSGGVDGIYGSGTEAALKAAGYPTVITEVDYNRIVFGTYASQPITIPMASNNELLPTGLKLVYTSTYNTTIWKEASQNWAGVVNGEKPITTIGPKTFLGMPTGVTLKDFIKVRNNIGGRDYYFWVKDFYIRIHNDLSAATTWGGKLKTDAEKAAIVANG